MLHRKLQEILELLSKDDLSKLRRFLQSPYFVRESILQNILELYDYIIAQQAGSNGKALNKKTVFELIFPAEKYIEGQKSKLDNLASELFQLVKKYLVQIAFENNHFDLLEGLELARFYRKNNNPDRFWHAIKTLKQLQEKQIFRDRDFYYFQLLITEEVVVFTSLHNSFEDDANIRSQIESLDIFYSIQRLDLSSSLLYQAKLANTQFELDPIIREILGAIHAKEALRIPVNYLFSLVVGLLNDMENMECFQEFEKALYEQRHDISPGLLNSLMAYYRFFWLRRYHKEGGASNVSKVFSLYKEHFEAGYFNIDGKISANAFRGLIKFALRAGHFDWVKNTLESTPEDLICGTRFTSELYNMLWAECFFSNREFDHALEKIAYRPFENPMYSLVADALVIKIYYETQNDLLDYRIKSMDQKVRRTRLSVMVKSRYYNF
ncbi:MAG: hypothetical protein IPL65_01880 [Lewinellaceae bacterium]|nr:hypothetical protein [Lewinellaceae bacterium]